MEEISLLHSELEKLSDLYNPFIVVLDFIFALERGNFVKEDKQWVYRPENFVTLDIHSQFRHNVTICLRGNPHEFAELPHLPLKRARNGYSRCKVEDVLQLDAALSYIRTAHELRKRGPSRIQKERKIVET